MTEQMRNHYLAMPASGRGAGVLVLHPWWGLNDFIRDFCDRLAQVGFVALAPDMFSGKIAQTPEEAEQIVTSLDWEQEVPPKILPAVADLKEHAAVNAGRLGVVGFSFGGFWALWLARRDPELVKAVTLFYATDGGIGAYDQSQAAFLGHFAETDPYEPSSGVETLEKTLTDASRPTTFYTYPGTGHWFFEKDRLDAYDPQAAQLAWERTIAFLHERLEERTT